MIYDNDDLPIVGNVPAFSANSAPSANDGGNAFIIGSGETPAVELPDGEAATVISMGDGTMEAMREVEPAPLDSAEADTIVGKIRDAFDRSNQAAWTTLGLIHEAAPRFPAGSSVHHDLIKKVKQRWSKGVKRDISGKPARLLFLDLLYGMQEKRSQKAQWKAALEGAAAANIEPSCEAFVDWIEGVGGIDGAAKTTSEQADANRPPAFHLKAFRDGLPDATEETVFQLPVKPRGDYAGLVVLLARRLNDQGKMQHLGDLADIELVQEVAQAVDHGASAQAVFERQKLLTINAAAFHMTTEVGGPGLSDRELKRLKRAVTALAANTAAREKYFNAEPSLGFDGETVGPAEGGKVRFKLHIQQSACKDLDPAKFIGGAKPAAMLMYEVANDPNQQGKAFRQYVDQERKYLKSVLSPRKPKSTEPSSRATLEAFLPDDEAAEEAPGLENGDA